MMSVKPYRMSALIEFSRGRSHWTNLQVRQRLDICDLETRSLT